MLFMEDWVVLSECWLVLGGLCYDCVCIDCIDLISG